MVWIPGGTFRMGSDEFYPEERPVHPVSVDGFWMDRTPVTVGAYARFVEATGYVTVSERPLDPAAYPDADPDLLVPGSAVFEPAAGPVDLRLVSWWRYVPGASWRHPLGPESSVEGLDHHPVTQVAWEDVAAYADWAGKAIATEAEWERAARGGLEGTRFAWGPEETLDGTVMANTWQGEFPWQNLLTDGYERTSPVGSFPANGYGVVDLIGNVWEWTVDHFRPNHPAYAAPATPCCAPHNPRVTDADPSRMADAPGATFARRVLKGGSHLCAPNYCLRYRPAARISETVDSATSHIGFRCVLRPG
jgi:formylglycine-generating enzyme required for sulfatase activity